MPVCAFIGVVSGVMCFESAAADGMLVKQAQRARQQRGAQPVLTDGR